MERFEILICLTIAMILSIEVSHFSADVNSTDKSDYPGINISNETHCNFPRFSFYWDANHDAIIRLRIIYNTGKPCTP
jgi:hypothetical protein